MRIPINWLRDYVNLPKNQSMLTDKLTMAGHMLDKTDIVDKEIVIDLELRGNRADCYSILGIAREVSALFSTPLKNPTIHPKLKVVKKLGETELTIKTPLVQRVMMVKLKNVEVMASPPWLQKKLKAYGIASINNIVDLTNFVMLETGEPLHAFDLAKIGKHLEIRLANANEKMKTFLGEKVTLTNDDLVWSDEKNVLSIAGAIGAKEHSISSATKDILLEAASYNQANIRRSIHKHNLLTEAGIRHEKELDPNLVEFGLYRFLHLFTENKWGQVEKQVFDYYPKEAKPWTVKFTFDFFSELSGTSLDPREIKKIFQGLNFKVLKEDKNNLLIEIPTYRTDVTLEEDLVEEVLRIVGYDKIPSKTLSVEIPKDVTLKSINQEIKLRESIVALGFDEIISLPFVSENSLSLNQDFNGDSKPVKVSNRPSPDLEELRLSMLPNLYSATQKVINERGTEARFFEIGRTYHKNKDYFEKRRLGVIYWKQNSKFEEFKGFIEALFTKHGVTYLEYERESGATALTNTYKIIRNKNRIGFGGQKGKIYFAELNLDEMLPLESQPNTSLWPKYPPQIEDITFQLPEQTFIGKVIADMRSTSKLIQSVELIDMYEEAYTFRIYYQDPTKTLNNKEVQAIREKVISKVSNLHGGQVK